MLKIKLWYTDVYKDRILGFVLSAVVEVTDAKSTDNVHAESFV